MISAITPAAIGIRSFGQRGRTIGRPAGGLGWPGDRKVMPSPLGHFGYGSAGISAEGARTSVPTRRYMLPDGNLPAAGKVPALIHARSWHALASPQLMRGPVLADAANGAGHGRRMTSVSRTERPCPPSAPGGL